MVSICDVVRALCVMLVLGHEKVDGSSGTLGILFWVQVMIIASD